MILVKIAGIHVRSQRKVVVMTTKKVALVEQTVVMPKLIALSHGCALTSLAVDDGRKQTGIYQSAYQLVRC